MCPHREPVRWLFWYASAHRMTGPEIIHPVGPQAGRASATAADLAAAAATPRTASAFPLRLTGTVTGTTIWLPLATAPFPEVRAAVSGALATAAQLTQCAVATPTALAAIPQTLAGTLTGAITWFPLSTEPSPEVTVPPTRVQPSSHSEVVL